MVYRLIPCARTYATTLSSCAFPHASPFIFFSDDSDETSSSPTQMEDDRPPSNSSVSTITPEKRPAKRSTALNSQFGGDGGGRRGTTRDQYRTIPRRPKSTKIRRESFRATPRPPPSFLARIRHYLRLLVDTNRTLTPARLPLLILELILLPIVLQLGLLVVGVVSAVGLLLLPVFVLVRTTDFKEVMAGS